VQTYYAILDLLVNELRKRRTAYSDFYQKLEVFLRSADMLSTEIVDCTKRLIESYREIDVEFPDELVHFLHFLSTQRSQTPLLKLHANNLPAMYPNVDTENLSVQLWNEGHW